MLPRINSAAEPLQSAAQHNGHSENSGFASGNADSGPPEGMARYHFVDNDNHSMGRKRKRLAHVAPIRVARDSDLRPRLSAHHHLTTHFDFARACGATR